MIRLRTDRQKEFVSRFDSLCQRNSRWTVWTDTMYMIATAISNTFDKDRAEAREKAYRQIIDKYTPEEQQVFPVLFGIITQALEDNPGQDFLGDLFMVLGLGNEHNGQFFTPYSVCRAIAAIQAPKKLFECKDWVSVLDPACGAGALLVAFANECKAQHINYQQKCLFVAQDIDTVSASMCYIQLSLLGCPGYVVIGDTLAHPALSYDDRGLVPENTDRVWLTPGYFMQGVWAVRRSLWALRQAEKQKPKKILPTLEKPEEKREGPEQLCFL